MSNVVSDVSAEWLSELVAGGPAPDLGERQRTFGQFVGDWLFDWTAFNDDGTRAIATGSWHFAWVLGGRAIQDIWVLPARHEREQLGSPLDEHGCSIRFFDSRSGTWSAVWVGPVNGNLRTFVVRETADEIILEGEAADGAQLRWAFSEIRHNRFQWRNERSGDGGRTWRLQETVSARRVPEQTLE